jgi:hypothetical protein
VKYLNHDHREGENIRFLTICPLTQDFWRSPPCSVTVLTRSALYGIHFSSDRSEAKIRQARATGIIHKDIWLGMRQCRGETKLGVATYSLEVPMNNIAEVEEVEAFSNVG